MVLPNPQSSAQVVRIGEWMVDEEFGVYPEGARDKSLIYSPGEGVFPFLRRNHRYLFKKSFSRYPDQFWAEIVAFRFAQIIGVTVPPAFVAVNERSGTCGALIEWFLNENASSEDRYVPGGDFMQRMIPSYDRKTGVQHNFESIEVIAKSLVRTRFAGSGFDWRLHWAKTFVFDALIGNTDRHQDNWGIIWQYNRGLALRLDSFFRRLETLRVRFAPAFDNGTSLGHEFFEKNFGRFDDPNYVAAYIRKGTHHPKWKLRDRNRCSHAELVALYVAKFPKTAEVVRQMLGFDRSSLNEVFDELVKFDVPVPLSMARADLMKKLIMARRDWLIQTLDDRK